MCNPGPSNKNHILPQINLYVIKQIIFNIYLTTMVKPNQNEFLFLCHVRPSRAVVIESLKTFKLLMGRSYNKRKQITFSNLRIYYTRKCVVCKSQFEKQTWLKTLSHCWVIDTNCACVCVCVREREREHVFGMCT